MTKKILGLDLGTNSIGWALVEIDHEKSIVKIMGLGSRILPMDAGEINDFESTGKIKSSTAQRTKKRSIRRMNERFILRRDRLHLVLNLLNALPSHYKLDIDFINVKGEKCGQFKSSREPKLAYLPKLKGRKAEFLFKDSYQEMLKELGLENKKSNRIPYDWTLYYLRQKALKSEITLEELAWVLLSYNQKRGYEKVEVENKSDKENEIVEELDLRVKEVTELTDKENKKYFEVKLDGIDNFGYYEYSDSQMTFKDDLKEVKVISKIDETGTTTSKEYTVIDIFSLKIKDVKYEKQDGKHKYTLIFHNGWEELKQPKNYTFRYEKAKGKEYEYIVETVYDEKGNIKPSQGKPRKLREPDFGDNSNDWTLLKKKTEKAALVFNFDHGYINIETKDPKKYISPQIYNILKGDGKSDNRTKIIGGMFQVVDRDFYREELNQVIETQKQFHNELKSKELFEQCVNTLYPKNETHAKTLLANKAAIQHLLVEDVLLYQRPLKSKKSEIANCKYEVQYWKDEVDKKTGEMIEKSEPIYLKVVSNSHPLFQEFRIWDKLHNLRLTQIEKEINGKVETNVDVTDSYFNAETYQKLFNLLNNQKSLSQSKLIDFLKPKFREKKEDYKNFVWNFPEDEEFIGNETRVSFAIRFKRCGFSEYSDFLTQQKELDLWHYLYSVNYKERTAKNNKSVTTFFNRFLEDSNVANEVKEKIIKDFANYPKYPSKYCAYSEKALKKLLPLIRLGDKKVNDHWTAKQSYTRWQQSLEERKNEILKRLKTIDFSSDDIDYSKAISTDTSNGNLPFPKGLFNAFRSFEKTDEFAKLNLTQASYLIYGRHSELAKAIYWNSPQDIREKLHHELKQHSLNNPVAEKVILEMMQVVADIWDYYGEGQEKFFSKIHLEVGRELKKSAKEKDKISNSQKENKAKNKRLRQVLHDFLSTSTYNANPNNNDHFERLKIVEEGAEHIKNMDKKFFENKPYTRRDIEDILKKATITKADFDKYKLWIEQGYISPYTNKIIKLTDLFNGNKYNIDHIFPQASVTNDSLSNKVVCELEINKLKSNQTGRELVNNLKQRRISCAAHKSKDNPNGDVDIVNDEIYVSIVKTQFSGTKRFILLSKEIPKGFTNSQLNNARHIARKAMELLSHIVREEGEVEFRSKNVLPVSGAVTSKLKKAWRLDLVWKELVAPRFIRMNELTQSNLFGQWQTSKQGQKYFDCNIDDTILEKDDSYDIKRIDHRHHALDALIVALCTEKHVNYINNINANAKSDNYGKQKQIEKYRETLKKEIKFSQPKREDSNEKDWFYMLPGEIRKQGAENSSRETVIEKLYFNIDSAFEKDYRKMILSGLQNMIVTFKQNLRVINKRVNYYQAEPNTKKRKAQEPKIFKDREYSQNKYNWGIRRSLGKDTFYGKALIDGEYKVVIRKDLDTTFNSDKIKTISDAQSQLKNILYKHLKQFDTVALPFEEALKYYNTVLQKHEIGAIIADTETKFQTIQDFAEHLKENKYEYKKTDYSKLNVFIEQVSDRDFRNEQPFKDNIIEHPEIAFTAEEIDKMNESENLKRLNGGKNHKPIRKVKISRGFGNQRALSEDSESVKSKQYVVNDAGSNLYLGFYERTYEGEDGNTITERKFQDVGLIELIESLKQDKSKLLNPLRNKIYDEKQNEYNWKFTLSPLDLVYVPAEEEIVNPLLVNFNNLSIEQSNRVYKYVDGGGGIANFIPYSVARPIWKFHDDKKKKEIHKELTKKKVLQIAEKDLIKDEFGFGSQQTKNQNMIDGSTLIKKICWKLHVDRLGNISPAKKKVINQSNQLNSTASEPEVAYKKSNLKAFSSFEEADEENARFMAHLSPEEHLKNVTERIQKIYEDELKKPMDKKIKFRK